MSGAEPPAGATSSGSSAAAVPPPPQQQQITAAQFSDVIREMLKQQQQQQEIAAARISDAIHEFIIQQQQGTTAAARPRSEELRSWLMFVASITASITYSAALNPPGGFWQADDATKGYIAGRPVLYDKSRGQYNSFLRYNLISFVMSLTIIVLVSYPPLYDRSQTKFLSYLVALDIAALGQAFFAGSSTIAPNPFLANVFGLLLLLGYIASLRFMGRRRNPGHIDRHIEQSVV